MLGLSVALIAGSAVAAQQTEPPPAEPLWEWDPDDPRIGLGAGIYDAEEAISNLDHLLRMPKPDAFLTSEAGGRGPTNSDLAFRDDLVFQGSYWGFQIFDASDPSSPEYLVGVVCPGGQGDLSVHGDLLFMSVEQTAGRLDCGTAGVQDTVSAERMRGVRIFDISDIRNPRQVKTVQTCRGSHTHTLVTDPRDDSHVYIYVSGTGRVRSPDELPGCSSAEPEEDDNTSLFRIEIIEVPVDRPEDAEIVNMPRIFADSETGEIAGLWTGGDHGDGTQQTRRTNQCHDITVRSDLGLAAGACSGNGILLDISDPENPVRIDQVIDPNFAYWHSATFNNDGTAIIFTDEWGGGGAPRCRGSDPETWGANAIFRIRDRKMELAGYYKLPVPQTEQENCVAHNGSLIPVPGRDIMVQAWYQGGVSIFDFTDPENPFEIAYFDRGPLDAVEMLSGGYWSTYWHNGAIYGAEMARGVDVFRLTPSEHLSQAEIDAALSVQTGDFNVQNQPEIRWPPSFALARSYLIQMQRDNGIPSELEERLVPLLDRAEVQAPGSERNATFDELDDVAEELEAAGRRAANAAGPGDARRLRLLAGAIRGLTRTLR
ncbi:MAG: hypothetical protein MJB57_09530 [Gemmatimonadetes bacterium]|nr:hypothetical protein [Gemmatimonadota bacterium]